MQCVVVPQNVATDRAGIWVGALYSWQGQPPPAMELQLTPAMAPVPLPAANWRRMAPGELPAQQQLHFWQFVDCVGLAPGQNYAARLVAGGATLATATFRTLPTALPPLGADPFNVLLGSCYSRLTDEQGDAGFSFANLPVSDRPHVKILCGDQVYLDQPTWQDFPRNGAWLANFFLEHYLKTWGRPDGYGRILSEGANYFGSDDHEFWNNYPNWTSLVNNSWDKTGREQWEKPARDLFGIFQNRKPDERPQRFDVPPLSFFILETRYHRPAGNTKFARDADMAVLRQWVAELNAKRWFGLLCVGQPIFAAPGSFFSTQFADRNFPDYDQYKDLVRILATARNSFVILTGDVHFGRVARCLLPSGATLYEIISSPLSLVDKAVGGKASPAPGQYPVQAMTGVTRVPVSAVNATDGKPALTPKENFLTMSCRAKGPSVQMQLKFWPVRTNRALPVPISTVELELVASP